MTSSQQLFERACAVIPGGVNSPVRAFGSVDADPVYIAEAKGASMTTVEGQTLIDFCCSWGPLILGHAPNVIVDALIGAAQKGTSYGVNAPSEVEIAELITKQIPAIEKVRLVSSGTEATMTALRLARGATGRSKILKFDGCYHGHHDSLLVAAGSGLLTTGTSSSAGVSDRVVADTLLCPYNDSAAVEKIFAEHGSDIAAIIVEPVAGNMGLVEPAHGFLESLRSISSAHGSLLIFDEVICGFRFCAGAYSSICGVTPDLTCLGKIIGGGLPIGAVGGSAAVMDNLSPLGAVYQAGTLSGNPVAVATGLAVMQTLIQSNPYADLTAKAATIAQGLNDLAAQKGIELCCRQYGSVFTPFFAATAPHNLDDVKKIDTSRYARFFAGMLQRGIYLPPSQFELAFISTAHSDEHIASYLDAAAATLESMA